MFPASDNSASMDARGLDESKQLPMRIVTPDAWRYAAQAAGWGMKVIELFLRAERGVRIDVKKYLKVGCEMLRLER